MLVVLIERSCDKVVVVEKPSVYFGSPSTPAAKQSTENRWADKVLTSTVRATDLDQ